MTTSVIPSEQSVTVQGVPFQVFRAGQGPTLLVLHDCEVSTDWQPYHVALAENFSVVAPSHPGFGGSGRPEEIDSVEDVAYLYLDFLDTLGSEPIDILGLGLGGWIAAEIAIRCSHSLRRLVLADSVGIKVSERTVVDIADTFILSGRQLLEIGWEDAALGAELMKLPDTPGLTFEEVVALARNRESAVRLTWKPFMHNPKLQQWLHRINVPTLVLWGENDRIVKPEYGQAFQQGIPGAKFQSIAKAGHYPYLEQPKEFVDAVSAFLS